MKIDIISGFLGAGKTTLIKKLFENAFTKEMVVLIENEFGEIGIDGAFLKESGVQIREINSGCICCSLVGDFTTSLREVITTYNPDRIIIEPSGVGKLSDIAQAVLKAGDDLKLNILATVVDGPKAKMYMKNFGEFFNNQVEVANTIIISKTDKMTEEKLLETVELIKEKNNHANLITTPVSELDGEKVLKSLEDNISLKDEILKEIAKLHEEEHHHHHDDDDECCHHHHHDDEDEEECCCHHHHHDDDDEECCHHHHHDDDDECCHHHHHDDEDEECCCHHHHDDEDEECCHHHHDDDEDEECCCHHHHHHDEDEECCHHHHHHHHADEVFTSWGEETPKSVSKLELEKFLNQLATDESLGIILRSKGLLKATDQEKWYYFDFVSGDYEIRDGEPDVIGKIVVIGSKIDEQKIRNLFYKK